MYSYRSSSLYYPAVAYRPYGPASPADSFSPADTRAFPPVDTKIFEASVGSFSKLMSDGSLLLKKLSDPGFAHQLMSASQEGKQDAVDSMLKSVGSSTPIHTSYTPTGVTFTLEVDGCSLRMMLRWGL
ncbi:hypothetical protein ACFFSY_12950 [Paenibacillus aurantiacus]|uniref:DUF3887 domain-containing protein n=1 Tax=Paenibacillus aurantiacus TaxID=1936118 RepID=A0ABV5KRU4_9BACL